MNLAALHAHAERAKMPISHNHRPSIDAVIAKASSVVSPVWPLKTFIACNPLQGYEGQPFEQALAKATALRKVVSVDDDKFSALNREMIKWLSVFLDEGQATIPMPNREQGFFKAFIDLIRFDALGKKKEAWIKNLPISTNACIAYCFDHLGINEKDYEDHACQSFAALPGWAGYIRYLTEWHGQALEYPITLKDYLAVRLILSCLLEIPCKAQAAATPIPHHPRDMEQREKDFRKKLVGKILGVQPKIMCQQSRPEAQMVFCIDVRSEPFRRAIEAQGNYETLGFAGFFGLPIRIHNDKAGEAYASCPVLLKPSHDIHEHDGCCEHNHARSGVLSETIKDWAQKFYRSLKYNLMTPFALVEILGSFWGLRMLVRTFMPRQSAAIKEALLKKDKDYVIDIHQIPESDQTDFAKGALCMMGLTQNFAPLVVFCGHGSTTTNNAYASALDCGACGGNHGGANARALAAMLNDANVRNKLAKRGIEIPQDTYFLAAEHDTTTDELKFYDADINHYKPEIIRLIDDCKAARVSNATRRCQAFGLSMANEKAVYQVDERSQNWAETRPEWGLARNAAFIVGHRDLTKSIDLEGRCFLHSYDWHADKDGKFLETILTAPMVVAQWINNQYLFSTLDNVNYGSGSKITQNVTGKIGVMQGNASDLMHGLSLQSVNASDDTAYHEPMRLLTVVQAPKERIKQLVDKHDILQKLFGNGWVTLACLDPSTDEKLLLGRDLSWQKLY